MDAPPFVSVIIPTYHDWDRLKLCLEALAQQSYPEEKFEVLVVNNDPDDRPPSLEIHAHARLLGESKPGSYAARNSAVRLARGELFAFTDSDCLPTRDWLQTAVKYLQAGTDRVAGHIEVFNKSERRTLGGAYESVFAFNQERNAESGTSVTANFACWRHCFDRVGLFNEDMLSGGDVEWNLRANAAGLTIQYAAEATVLHPARESLKELFQKRKRLAGGALNLARYKRIKFLSVRGVMPPIEAFAMIIESKNITLREKIALLPISYLLKLYKTGVMIAIRSGWLEPSRQ